MRLRGAQRIGGLERMPPLDAPPTRATAADVHAETAHVRMHDRQLLLDLIRDSRCCDHSATARAGVGQRNIDRLVNAARRLPMPMAPMTSTWAAAGGLRCRRGGALRERRRWPLGRTPGQIDVRRIAPEKRLVQ